MARPHTGLSHNVCENSAGKDHAENPQTQHQGRGEGALFPQRIDQAVVRTQIELLHEITRSMSERGHFFDCFVPDFASPAKYVVLGNLFLVLGHNGVNRAAQRIGLTFAKRAKENYGRKPAGYNHPSGPKQHRT